MEFLSEDTSIAVHCTVSLIVAIPATMLAASFSSLPERYFRRAVKAGFLIFMSWLFFTVISFNIANPTVSLMCSIADFFVRTSFFELTYKSTFTRGMIAALLFFLISSVLAILATMVLGVGFGYLFLAMLGAKH